MEGAAMEGTGPPEVRYTRSGDVVLAYQVTGQGPLDLVFVPGWISNIELAWELPEFARFLGRLAGLARLIWFDKRGTGLSDRVTGPVTLEERSDDIRAVMDAAGSRQAAVVGWYEGGAIAASFAASYPDRVRALVIGSFTARAAHDAGEPWGIDPAMMDLISKRAEDAWGTAAIAELVSPSTTGNPLFLAFWRRYERASASPTAAATMIRWNLAIDVRATLPAISCPTLVIHRKDVRLVPAAAVRHVASQIPGSRYTELDGQDMFPVRRGHRRRSRCDPGVPDRRPAPRGNRSGSGDPAIHRCGRIDADHRQDRRQRLGRPAPLPPQHGPEIPDPVRWPRGRYGRRRVLRRLRRTRPGVALRR